MEMHADCYMLFKRLHRNRDRAPIRPRIAKAASPPPNIIMSGDTSSMIDPTPRANRDATKSPRSAISPLQRTSIGNELNRISGTSPDERL
jgi:hypothetical protein